MRAFFQPLQALMGLEGFARAGLVASNRKEAAEQPPYAAWPPHRLLTRQISAPGALRCAPMDLNETANPHTRSEGIAWPHMAKLEPQPQEAVACGLLILNAAPMRSAL